MVTKRLTKREREIRRKFLKKRIKVVVKTTPLAIATGVSAGKPIFPLSAPVGAFVTGIHAGFVTKELKELRLEREKELKKLKKTKVSKRRAKKEFK